MRDESAPPPSPAVRVRLNTPAARKLIRNHLFAKDLLQRLVSLPLANREVFGMLPIPSLVFLEPDVSVLSLLQPQNTVVKAV